MKKILFASTALVATAGFASAEVTGSGAGTINIKGVAEIGVMGGTTAAGTDIDTQFFTDIDVIFAMTGEADNGLTFGATVDIDEVGTASGATNNNADDGGATYFLAFGGARLDMGDTDGAFDAVMKESSLAAGSMADDETAHYGFAHPAINLQNGLDGGGDGQIARFSYSYDSFTGHFSVEQVGNGAGDTIYGLGFRYNADLAGTTVGVGIGYQTQKDTVDLWGISLDTALSNGLLASLSYAKLDINGGGEVEYTAVGLGYSMNNIAVGVNYGQYDTNFGADTSGFGIAAHYDFGGGLKAQLGYGQGDSENNWAGEPDSFSLGLRMDF